MRFVNDFLTFLGVTNGFGLPDLGAGHRLRPEHLVTAGTTPAGAQ